MHAPSTHTGLPSDLLAAATASMACPSTSCAAHSSTGTHADTGTTDLTRPRSPHDTAIACAASWSITRSSSGGMTVSRTDMVLVAGSVVASLGASVRSTRAGSPAGTRTTLHTSPLITNGLTCRAWCASRASSSRAPRGTRRSWPRGAPACRSRSAPRRSPCQVGWSSDPSSRGSRSCRRRP